VSNRPRVIACIPAYDEENAIGGVVFRSRKYVDRVVICDDDSVVGWLVHDPYIGAFFSIG
jgi:hypothetical protein